MQPLEYQLMVITYQIKGWGYQGGKPVVSLLRLLVLPVLSKLKLTARDNKMDWCCHSCKNQYNTSLVWWLDPRNKMKSIYPFVVIGIAIKSDTQWWIFLGV